MGFFMPVAKRVANGIFLGYIFISLDQIYNLTNSLPLTATHLLKRSDFLTFLKVYLYSFENSFYTQIISKLAYTNPDKLIR